MGKDRWAKNVLGGKKLSKKRRGKDSGKERVRSETKARLADEMAKDRGDKPTAGDYLAASRVVSSAEAKLAGTDIMGLIKKALKGKK